MTVGLFLILIAFLTCLISLVSFYQSTGDDGKLFKLGKQMFIITQAFITLSGLLLLYYFITHQFQYNYVSSYSSRALPFFYLVSAFWAGQEGSFLMWTLFTVWFGWWFLRTNKVYTAWSMVFVNGIVLFFLAMMIKKSPFALLPNTPSDGAGLNPLLQDPWMVIHPPLLFLGYAAVVFPYALAMAALVHDEYNDWARYAQPWVVVTVLFLGGGIIIGGYWAYKVLGWGGYWGWDPVENSSLIPWVTSIILLHGLVVQRVRTALKRTNIFTALITMLLVVYATFLTRSGVLGDFSVHSFGDLGLNGYLIAFMLYLILTGGYWCFRRFKGIESESIEPLPLNRANTIAWSLIVLGASAILTLIGTSSPILTRIYSEPSNVSTSFYNQVHLPIGILAGLFLGISPLMLWRGNNWPLVKNKFYSVLGATLLSVLLAYFLGVKETVFLTFLGTTFFALFINLIALYLNFQTGWPMTAGPLTHVGLTFMLIGIITSSVYETKERVTISSEKTGSVFGYQMNYQGLVTRENGKDEAMINIITPSQTKVIANPQFYYSQYNQGVMKSPYILRNILYDIYISPVGTEQGNEKSNVMTLTKGQAVPYENYQLTFEAFDMSEHKSNNGIRVGAKIKINSGQKDFMLNPAMLMTTDGKKEEPAWIPDTQIRMAMVGMNVESKSVDIRIQNPDKPDQSINMLTIEVSKKPLINFLWFGTVVLLAGCLVTIRKRTQRLD